ncbi:glycoside hydrolase family 66 protein [Lactococcus nasutitermitis]|uniref:Glycoside hydrolase family 66 protein n=1 Tax=Lactococcus nasutitermitis TaxID=1652957 RepID=A0ABV9JEP9_9LACT|nr:glycoside hydrolase family 66 protein [Lactococcus nasutitermitis]
MNFKKIMIITVLFGSLSVMTGAQADTLIENSADKKTIKIEKITTDKARYLPKDKVTTVITVKNPANVAQYGTGKLKMNYLEKEISELDFYYQVEAYSEKKLSLQFSLPAEDLKGYLLDVTLADDDKKIVSEMTNAVDVSSNVTKFPRYGYLTSFDTFNQKNLEQMKDFHLNLIQNYDWYDGNSPQIPMPQDENGTLNRKTWQNYMGKTVKAATVIQQNDFFHQMNMQSMAYDMIYAMTNPLQSELKSWGLMNFENYGDYNGGQWNYFTIGKQFYMDIGLNGWRDFIGKNVKNAVETLHFDGWHGDTIGEWGKHYNASYQEVEDKTVENVDAHLVSSQYFDFLNYQKENFFQNKLLALNPVGSIGLQNSVMSRSDIAYTEMWGNGSKDKALKKNSDGSVTNTGVSTATYQALKDNIDLTRQLSGKSLIVANYQEHNRVKEWNKSGIEHSLNKAAMLLSEAEVVASGGSRVSLGDGQNALNSDYFPDKTLKMDGDLLFSMQNYQNFQVAYQNLLRDGQENNENEIQMNGKVLLNKQAGNQVQAFAKSTTGTWETGTDTIQLINFVGNDLQEWEDGAGVAADDSFDNNGQHHFEPAYQKDFTVKYYTNKNFKEAYVTSPDYDFQGKQQKLQLNFGSDEKGKYVEFKVSSLEYWDMVVLK